jgi:hypothetical protein
LRGDSASAASIDHIRKCGEREEGDVTWKGICSGHGFDVGDDGQGYVVDTDKQLQTRDTRCPRTRVRVKHNVKEI